MIFYFVACAFIVIHFLTKFAFAIFPIKFILVHIAYRVL